MVGEGDVLQGRHLNPSQVDVVTERGQQDGGSLVGREEGVSVAGRPCHHRQ